jgi:hypothetical protein
MNFIKTGQKDKNFDKLIKKINTESKSWVSYDFSKFIIGKKPDFNNVYENRLMELSINIDLYRTLDRLLFTSYTDKFDYKMGKEIFDDLMVNWDSINYSKIVNYLTYRVNSKYYGLDETAILKEYLKTNIDETFKALSDSSGRGLEASLDLFYEFDKEKTYNFVVTNIETFSGKKLLEKIIAILKEKQDLKLLKELSIHKKTSVREIAVTVIIQINDPKNIDFLTQILNNDKNKNVQNLIMEYFTNLNGSISNSSDGNEFTKEWFIEKSNESKIKFPLFWTTFSELPKLHWLEGDEVSENDVKYFLSLASTNKKVIPSNTFRKFGDLINKDELAVFSNKVYELWNRDTKTKWSLAFVAAFGDDSLIKPLKDEILNFVDYGRGAIAAQMVEAIAMIGTTKAFQTVDWFSKKVRHKQVKSAANEALITAATELNISKDDLLDKIIPNFGFSESGELVLDFGERQFNIKLNSDLSFIITDNNGKKFKDLPKPNKSDDAQKSSESVSFFKDLKKEIKAQIKIQKERLENGFSSNRLWKFNAWSELFLKNPMMKQFALNLLWGEYKEGGLKKTFRFLEDGSFLDINEEEIKFDSNNDIGLVHPIELSKDKLETWKEQFNDYEIVQPFKQLERNVYYIKKEDEDKSSLDDFMGYLITRASLKNKLFNKGWQRGSVQDAGCYYEYYKDLDSYKMSVELSFEGDCVGGFDDYDDVPIKHIVFYVSDTVKRGSYIYDTPSNENVFSLKQIPKRLYSEIYNEIKTIAESGTGFDPEWEKKSYW